MEYRTVCRLYNININMKYKGVNIFDDINLISNKVFFSEYFNDDFFVLAAGTFHVDSYMNSPFFYTSGNNHELTGSDSAYKFLENRSILYNDIIFFLWLIKDNAATCEESFVRYKTIMNEKITMYQRSFRYSNSEGKYDTTYFSNKEFEEASKLMSQFSIFNMKYLDNINNVQDGIIHSQKYEEYFHLFGLRSNRYQRARSILDNARTENYAPARISAYTIILEAFFSTNNNEVATQVSQRIANFLCESRDEKIELYKFIKEVYNIRSLYVHGEKLTIKYGKKGLAFLINMSTRLDSILRKIFMKIISDEELIYLYVDDNTEKLEQYLLELVM